MSTNYFRSCDDRRIQYKVLDAQSMGGFLKEVIDFVKDNKGNIVDTVKTGIAVKDIIKSSTSGKSDKDIIEEMKTETIYKDLVDLDNLNKLRTGSGFRIL